MTQKAPNSRNEGMAELALVKGRHRWVFRYERGQELLALRTVAQAAASGLGLDWTDAAVLVRQLGYRFATNEKN